MNDYRGEEPPRATIARASRKDLRGANQTHSLTSIFCHCARRARRSGVGKQHPPEPVILELSTARAQATATFVTLLVPGCQSPAAVLTRTNAMFTYLFLTARS